MFRSAASNLLLVLICWEGPDVSFFRKSLSVKINFWNNLRVLKVFLKDEKWMDDVDCAISFLAKSQKVVSSSGKSSVAL